MAEKAREGEETHMGTATGDLEGCTKVTITHQPSPPPKQPQEKRAHLITKE